MRPSFKEASATELNILYLNEQRAKLAALLKEVIIYSLRVTFSLLRCKFTYVAEVIFALGAEN